MAKPGVTIGIEALRRDNPWPEFPRETIEPFYLSLDGGGREIITDLIQDRKIKLMVEVGCFLCGSTRQWLEASPDLTVIGVDPWGGNWSPYLRESAPRESLATVKDMGRVLSDLEKHGNFRIALNNIREFKQRFIPVRQYSPAALEYLKQRGIVPQMIYVDAFKEAEDLYVASALFPNAILCGDDWDWADKDGRMKMQENVKTFAKERNFNITADCSTWALSPGRAAGGWDPNEIGLR